MVIGTKLSHAWSNGNDWVLDFVPLQNESTLAASLSNGVVNTYSLVKPYKNAITSINAHPGTSISKIVPVMNWSSASDGSVFASCAAELVKVWDIRTNSSSKPVLSFKSPRDIPILSVVANHGLIACGTELRKQDAEIHLWDLRNPGSILRSLVDSQNDDVTDLKFHPLKKDILISGSTDGCVNVYDLAIEDENDCLQQVINFASIHSTGFLSPNRIYTLSHMETFAIHELNDFSTEENVEPKPVEFGDVRESWKCDYVVDVYYNTNNIAVGSNSDNCVKVLPFFQEKVDLENYILLQQPHGDEITRSVFVPSVSETNTVISGGEDGRICIWTSDQDFMAPLSLVKASSSKKSKKKKHSQKVKNDKLSKHRFKPY